MVINGFLAGLAGITSGSGFISTDYVLISSFVVSSSSFFCAKYIKSLGIEDVLDVFSL